MKALLACQACRRQYPLSLRGRCDCGGIVAVRYDLERAARTLTRTNLLNRAASMWRYFELLPVDDPDHIVTLGEGWTPLLRLRQAEERFPLGRLWIKREEQNPTGSFKARGMAAAISMAKEHSVRKTAVNSNGNAASAMAAYAGAAGMEAYVFLPQDCPGLIVEECIRYGASTWLVDGLIHDAGAVIDEGVSEQGWHHVGTLKEPGRAEGKKTMGFELAEQLHWQLPDVIIYPTGGGSGLIGMWNAFHQLKELALVEGDMPRFVAVQESGCEPVVEAVQGRQTKTGPASSQPTGMRVPHPPDLAALVSIIRQSGGTALSVSAEEIRQAGSELGRIGISASPEGAAAWAALYRLSESRFFRPADRVVVFNTSHALKYVPWNAASAPIVRQYADWKLHRHNEESSATNP